MKFVAPFRHPGMVLEAAYDLGQPMDAWLRRLLRAMANDLDGGLGLYALVLDIARDEFSFLGAPVFHRLSSEARRIAPGLIREASPAVTQHFRRHVVEFGSVSQIFGRSGLAPVQERGLPFADSVGLSVQDGEGSGLQFISLMPDIVRVHGRSRTAWRKLGLHLGIAWRLRQRLARGRAPEALIENGKLVDARGLAKARSARESLIEATRCIEQARTSKLREEPERVLELWRGLVSGRWSLVDKWDSDGRRYVAAYENCASVGKVPGFADWEMQVLQMHLLRASGGEIAFALGLSSSTVERVLSAAVKRVGLRSRGELARLSEPGLVTRLALDVGSDRIDVLRFDSKPISEEWQARLTKAQLEVASMAASGRSDSEIAEARGSSVRTVSNLLLAAYRRLGLRGRTDLVNGPL